MKLCIIGNANSIHTIRWVRYFAQHGYEVHLISDKAYSGAVPDQVAFYDLTRLINVRKARYLAWIWSLRRLLYKIKPDIVHAHQVSGAGWLAASSGFHPLVITPWGSDLYQHARHSRLARRLAFYVLRRADLVTADSRDLCNTAIGFGAVPGKTHLIQWGVDTNVFHPNQASDTLCQQLGLEGKRVLLSIRRVHPLYQLDAIIGAMEQIQAAVPDATLVLRDYSAEPAYKTQLERQIAASPARTAIRWLGPLARWEDSAATYRLAKVALSVPASDGTPVSVLEAMACGVPVVASDLPSLREWITPGENGLLVPVGSVNALAEAVIQLLHRPEMAETFRQRSLAIIHQRADHRVEMTKMDRLYRALLGQSAPVTAL